MCLTLRGSTHVAFAPLVATPAIAGAFCPLQVAWNPLFHIAAVCSFASWAPMLLLAYDPRVADVALSIGHKNSLELMGKDRKQVGAVGPRDGCVTRVKPHVTALGERWPLHAGHEHVDLRSQPTSVTRLHCDLCP